MNALTRQLDGLARRDWADEATGTVRVAVVGLGWWTREEALPALSALSTAEATVAVSGTPDKRTAVAEEWGVDAIDYEAYADGERAAAYDAVYVCTPNARHLDHVRPAAEQGKAVLCEKPMEVSPERGKRLVAACEAADVPLMIGYRMQTDPAVRQLRSLVRSGLIGEPIHVQGHMSQPATTFFDSDSWRFDPALAGRGASVTDLGIYPLNTTRFLLETEPASVRAEARSERPAFADLPDEHATFSVSFADGVRGQFAVSQGAQLTGGLEIVGTDGAIRTQPAFFDRDPGEITLRRGDETASVRYQPVNGTREEFAYFTTRLLRGEPLEPDGHHALVDLAAIDAVYDAAESDQTASVSVDLPN